jgi:hypothetical protein
MHVGDLDGSSAPLGSNWNASVTIVIHDSLEDAVANATITGNWSNAGKGTSAFSCTTDASGVCMVTKTGLRGSVSSVILTVTNVTHSASVYSSTSNHDPDGDSNGTTIVVLKP